MKTGILIAFVCFSGSCHAQAVGNTARAPDSSVETRSVGMASSKQLSGMPPFQVVIDPMQCDAGGKTYLEGFDLSTGHLRTLYSVSNNGTVKMLPRNPPELDDLQFMSFYPGEDSLITLMQARKRSAATPSDSKLSYYLYVTRPDGTSGEVLPIDLGIQLLNAAILRSGNILVLGLEQDKRNPTIVLLGSNGALLRRLDITDSKYGASQELLKVYGEKRNDLRLILSSAKFVPFKDKVLLIQPASSLPVIELDDSGVSRVVSVKLPSDYLPDSMITSDYHWIIRARTIGDAKKLIGSGVIMGVERALFEVDPEDGSVLSQLKLSDIHTSELTCAIGGEFVALHADSDDTGNPASDRWTLWSGKK